MFHIPRVIMGERYVPTPSYRRLAPALTGSSHAEDLDCYARTRRLRTQRGEW
jgi:hypothetical protein